MILHYTQASPLVTSYVCYQDFHEGVEQPICQTLVSDKGQVYTCQGTAMQLANYTDP